MEKGQIQGEPLESLRPAGLPHPTWQLPAHPLPHTQTPLPGSRAQGRPHLTARRLGRTFPSKPRRAATSRRAASRKTVLAEEPQGNPRTRPLFRPGDFPINHTPTRCSPPAPPRRGARWARPGPPRELEPRGPLGNVGGTGPPPFPPYVLGRHRRASPPPLLKKRRVDTAARPSASTRLSAPATGLSPEKMAAEEAAEASLAQLSPEQRQPGREGDDEENPESSGETAALSEGRVWGGVSGRAGGVAGARPSVPFRGDRSGCSPSSRVCAAPPCARDAAGGGRAPCGGAGGRSALRESPVRV